MAVKVVAAEGDGVSTPLGVELDASGNVYVAGNFWGTVDFDGGGGTQALVSSGTYDGSPAANLFLAKYDADGNLVRVATTGPSTAYEVVNGFDINADGEAWIAGNFRGSVDFDPGAAEAARVSEGTLTANDDFFLARYGADGSLQWVVTPVDSTRSEGLTSVAVDPLDNAHVVGRFNGTLVLDAGTTLTFDNAVEQANFIAKYDGAGSLAWAYGTDERVYFYSVATDDSGNTFVTGVFKGTVDFGFGPGSETLENGSGQYNLFVARYDADGSLAWVTGTGPSVGSQDAYDVTVDGAGNVLITGRVDGSVDFDPSTPGVATVEGVNGASMFVAKYDAAGQFQWVTTPQTNQVGDIGQAVTTDGAGNVYVTGQFGGSVDFDAGPGTAHLVATGGTDHFVARYDVDGTLVWVTGPGASSGIEAGFGVAVDPSGNTHVVGDLYGTADFDPRPDVTVTEAAGDDRQFFLARYTPDGLLSHPETSIESGPSGLVATTSATFDLASDAPSATFLYQLDGRSVTAATDPLTLSGLGQGGHTLTVWAKDSAGNADLTPAKRTWMIDSTPPDTSFATAPAAGGTTGPNVTLDFAATEDSVTFELKLDSGNFSLTTDPRVLSGLSDGEHTIEVRAIDAAGNLDPTPATRTWIVDATAPDTEIVSGPDSLTAAASATFDFSSELDATFQYKLDDGGYLAATDPLTLTGLSEGEHTLTVRAIDAYGNADTTPATWTWTIDSLPPDTEIVSGPAGITGSTTATFDLSSEPDATFEYKLDDGDYLPATDPLTLTGLPDGPHVLAVRAIDDAGNADTSPANWEWVVDLTPPGAPTVAGFADNTGDPADALTTDRTLVIFGEAEPSALIHVRRDGVEVGTAAADTAGAWTFDDSATTLAFGRHVYSATAEDAVGNAGPPSDGLTVLVAGGSATNGDDVLAGTAAANAIDGKNGDDTIYGEDGNDTLKGGNGNDSLAGGGDRDALWGGGGDDTLAGGDGNDTVFGENGNDRIDGGAGDDRLEGGAGSDRVEGGAGDDTVSGGDGNDTIFGGDGADRLLPQAGFDRIGLGLDGARDIVFGTLAQLSGDTIAGFETGASGDAIAITGLASKYGKLLDSLVFTDGLLSLSKVGGGELLLEGLEGSRHVDTMLGGDGAILLYIV